MTVVHRGEGCHGDLCGVEWGMEEGLPASPWSVLRKGVPEKLVFRGGSQKRIS